MGGRGASSGGNGGFTGGNSSLNPADIVSTTSLVSAREGKQQEVDETLAVFRDVADEYGYVVDDIQIATLKGKGASTMAYYDGQNIAVNKTYFDKAKMESAYEKCVEQGFHPSKGNKTALQAVASHELGHALTDAVESKMSSVKGDRAIAILNEAKSQGKFKGSLGDMAGRISGYAKYNPREAIAEAFSDVYCNGKSATKESIAIVNVMNKYLKNQ